VVTGNHSSNRYYQLGTHAAIVLLGVLTYFGVWDNSLYKDDYVWMTAARDDMRGAGILLHQTAGFFRPMSNVVFYVGEHIAPGNIAVYNVTNLVIHLVNSILVLHLLRVLYGSRFVAAAAAVIFVAAQSHSGAVLWVSARTTLVMTGLLLASFLVAAGAERSLRRTAPVLLFYALALATKETAVAGLGLAGLLFLRRRWSGETGIDAVTLGGYVLVTVVYLAVRTAVMGPVDQDNWGLGTHAVANIFGGVLYSYYPWVLTHIVGPTGALRPSASPLWPEAVGALVVVALVAVSPAGRRRRGMMLAVGWTMIALVPASFFTFRFLEAYSLVHNRYYYLAGVGVSASVAMIAGWLWSSRVNARTARTAAVAVVLLAVSANVFTVREREAHWGYSNSSFERMVRDVVAQVAAQPEMPTVVVTGLSGWQPYVARAIEYFRPERPVVYEPAGPEGADGHRPCLLVDLDQADDKSVTFRMYELR
jgi:hypothetical protein